MTLWQDIGTRLDYYAQSMYYLDIDIYIIMTLFIALIAVFTFKSVKKGTGDRSHAGSN